MKCRPGSKDAYAALLKIQVGRVDSKLMGRHSQRKRLEPFFLFLLWLIFFSCFWLVGCLLGCLVSKFCLLGFF